MIRDKKIFIGNSPGNIEGRKFIFIIPCSIRWPTFIDILNKITKKGF